MAGRSGQHLALAVELGLTIDRTGPRRIGLDVRARPACVVERGDTVEHIVGRNVQQRRADLGGRPREVAGAVGVDRVGLGLLGLGTVDIGPGGAVDGGLGPLAREERVHGRQVGDVQLG